MTKKWIVNSALAMGLAIPGGMLSVVHAHAAPANGAAAIGVQDRDQDRDWQRAPDGYNDVQRKGFHDGMEAARRDSQSNRREDMDHDRMYRHPPVEREDGDRYREGFRRGYETAMQHMTGDRDHHEDHPQ